MHHPAPLLGSGHARSDLPPAALIWLSMVGRSARVHPGEPTQPSSATVIAGKKQLAKGCAAAALPPARPPVARFVLHKHGVTSCPIFVQLRQATHGRCNPLCQQQPLRSGTRSDAAACRAAPWPASSRNFEATDRPGYFSPCRDAGGSPLRICRGGALCRHKAGRRQLLRPVLRRLPDAADHFRADAEVPRPLPGAENPQFLRIDRRRHRVPARRVRPAHHHRFRAGPGQRLLPRLVRPVAGVSYSNSHRDTRRRLGFSGQGRSQRAHPAKSRRLWRCRVHSPGRRGAERLEPRRFTCSAHSCMLLLWGQGMQPPCRRLSRKLESETSIWSSSPSAMCPATVSMRF